MNFGHYTDRSVRLAVDLVNSYWWAAGREEMPDVTALRKWIADHDETAEVDEGDLAELRDYRARLRAAFEAPDETATAAILNELLVDCGATPRISTHDDHPIHMHFEPRGAGFAKWLGATSAMALAIVLCDYGKERLGVCAASRCGDAFVDTSKNRKKRYCNNECANRENVAAYRARQRSDA